MPFHIDDQVVHPAYGIGRIVGLVAKRYLEAEARLYYEIVLERTTVWMPADDDAASGLRPLTPRAELARYRGVLRSCPMPLTGDHRQRHLDLVRRLKVGTFQDRCEMVRDLTAHGWHRSLGEGDTSALRKAREGVCQEWAAVDGVSVQQATAEVTALLLEGRQAHNA